MRKATYSREALLAVDDPLVPIPTGVTPRVEVLKDIRCMAFDIYGTLLISGSGDISLVKEGLAEGLKDAIEVAHTRRRAEGIAFPEVEIRAIWRELLGESDEAVEAHAIAYERKSNPVWPMPGLRAVLDAVQDYTLGIVSNAQFYTPLVLEAALEQPLEQLGFLPEHCVYSYQHLEAKPSPRLFERLVAATGIPAAQTLYLGNDMLNDVWAASQAGMRTALFAGDRRSLRMREDRPECRELVPDVIITELEQLPLCLESN